MELRGGLGGCGKGGLNTAGRDVLWEEGSDGMRGGDGRGEGEVRAVRSLTRMRRKSLMSRVLTDRSLQILITVLEAAHLNAVAPKLGEG